MAHVWVLFCLFVVLVPQSSAQWVIPSPLSEVERYLYAQLEDALVNDAATLEQLREVFFQPPRPYKVQFHINITADFIAAGNCSKCVPDCGAPWPCALAFCAGHGTSQWQLCSSDLKVTWATEVYAVELLEALANTVLPWCAHGLSLMVPISNDLSDTPGGNSEGVCDSHRSDFQELVNLHISAKELNCNPYYYELFYAVGEFFTWVSVAIV